MTAERDELEELIRAIVEDETGAPVKRIEPVDGEGEVNDVRFVSTMREKFVIRIARDPDSIHSYYKEEWCIAATANLIPGPRVTAVGMRNERPYMIQTRIPGVVATRSSRSPKEIWMELGRYARLLDTVAVQGYGYELTARDSGVFRNAWTEIVDWHTGHLFDDDLLVSLGALTRDDHGEFRARVAATREWTFEPRLSHGNFAEKNTIVSEDGTLSVIDWGTAEASRGLPVDVAEVATWDQGETLKWFLAGCEIDSAAWRRMQWDVDVLVIRRAMGSVRWAHAMGHPNLAGFVSVARAHADRIRAGEPPFGIP